MKKLISLSFCFIALLAVLTFSSFASAQNSGTLGDSVSWIFDDASGKLTITGVGETKSYFEAATPFDTNKINNKITSVEIAEGITGIGSGLFEDCTALAEVSLPESLVSIERSAFEDCTSLKKIDLPPQLESIGKNAFKNTGLTDVTVLRGISYGDGVYENCRFLNAATISNSLRYLPAYIFSNSSLTSITGGAKLERIGKGAFKNCTELSGIDCTNVTAFDEDCFSSCKLNYVEIGNLDVWAKKKFANEKSTPVPYAKYVLSEGRSVTDITFFDSDKISAYAFYGMKGVKSITLGNGVKKLGTACFANCSDVESIAILNEKISFSVATFKNTLTNKLKTYVSIVPSDPVLSDPPESLEKAELSVYSVTEQKKYPYLSSEEYNVTYTLLKKGEHTHVFIPTVMNIKERSTCQINGSADLVCPICFETKSVSLSKAEHVKSINTLVPATIEADGSETYACVHCNEKDITVIPQIADIKLFNEKSTYGFENPVLKITDRTGEVLSVLYYKYKCYPDFKNHCTVVTFMGKYSGEIIKDFEVVPSSVSAIVTLGTNLKEISVKPIYRELPYEAKLHICLAKFNEPDKEVAVFDVAPDMVKEYIIADLDPHTHYIVTMFTTSGDNVSDKSKYVIHTDLAEGQEPSSKKDPTCTENGSIVYKCKNCNAQKKITIPKLGHDLSDTKVPDRTVYPCAPYYLSTICKRCKYAVENELVPAEKEHTFVTGTVTKGGLWYTGTKEIVCSVCNETAVDEVYFAVSGVSIPKDTYAYTGSEIKPKVTIECVNDKNLDSANYSVSYSNNVNVGTATITVTLKGNYSGEITKTFKITKNVPDAVVTFSEGPYYFTSEDPVTPKPVVKDKNGVLFVQGLHYKLSYSNNTQPGTAKMKITFIGNYSGSIEKTFKIAPNKVSKITSYEQKTTSLAISWSVSENAWYYRLQQSTDGKTWKTIATTANTNYTVKELTAGTKYYFRVCALDSSKKIASSYTSFQTQTLCTAPTIKLTSTMSKTATVSWSKITGATKYVVYKSIDGKNWTKVGETTKLTYDLTKLSAGKKIYVKVVAVNTYGKASTYSSVKNVTVKK